MKIVKSTGLAPVQSHRDGSIFGLTPAGAKEYVQSGQGSLHPIPDGIETEDVPGFDLPAPRAEAADTDQGGVQHAAPGKAAKAKGATTGAKKGKATDKSPPPVVIPADWRNLQWMKQVKLAEAISGGKLTKVEGKKPGEVAAEIVAAEETKRLEAGKAGTAAKAADETSSASGTGPKPGEPAEPVAEPKT